MVAGRSRRRGRPRKSGARTPSGRLSRAGRRATDDGAYRVRARRGWLAQEGEEALAVYPLGIMRANDVIDECEHSAGLRYAWLAAVVIGRASPAAVEFARDGGAAPKDHTDEQRAGFERHYGRARAALLVRGRRTKLSWTRRTGTCQRL